MEIGQKLEEIKSLATLISRNKVKQIDVIGNSETATHQASMLYNHIVSGEIEEDSQIIATFFADKDPKNAAFYCRRLKRKLTNRLINTLFFIDINQPNFNKYNQAFYTLYKQAAAVKIMLANFARPAAIQLAEEAIKKAIQFELTDVVFSLAEILSRHYATIDGNSKKFKEYDALCQQYFAILSAEHMASSYYNQLRIHFTKAKSFQPEAVEDARVYSEKLKELIEKGELESFNLRYFSFLVHAIRYEVTNDYQPLLEVCEEALIYFMEREDRVPMNVFFNFTLRKFICHTRLMQYDQAWAITDQCLGFVREGINNWFLALEYFMILAFQTGLYQDAYRYYVKAATRPEYEKLQLDMAERWRMYEAYVHYLIARKIIQPDGNAHLKRFRRRRFMNEFPMYSKDKRGINISIIVLQILFFLLDKQYGEIIDRVESLKVYTQRYLRQDDTFRSNCFIQMLLVLPACSFHRTAVIRKAEYFRKKLQSRPIDVANQTTEIEPVPYEVLWSFVLNSLDEKAHHVRKTRTQKQ